MSKEVSPQKLKLHFYFSLVKKAFRRLNNKPDKTKKHIPQTIKIIYLININSFDRFY